ncbi:hypothetical protein APT_00572 [Acetobacter pasteurianus NBRC 101655]|nr:hypothetical protein APT_00572 [Acetobacter pasteurianus NBRC 101655]CCT60167.1 hypothetical protein APA386B_2118 [Acetobacter pasteurianus 386B]
MPAGAQNHGGKQHTHPLAVIDTPACYTADLTCL